MPTVKYLFIRYELKNIRKKIYIEFAIETKCFNEYTVTNPFTLSRTNFKNCQK